MAKTSTTWTKGNAPGAGRPKLNFNIREEAGKFALKALQTLVDALDADNQADRIKAANSLLDRGYGKPLQELAGEVNGTLQVIIRRFTPDK